MHEPWHELVPVLVLLMAGLAAITGSRWLRLSPIVGYIVFGTAIGGHGLGWVQENETTALLAELGVVFLLFDIGMHFSLRRLWETRGEVFGLGPLQVVLSGGAFTLGLWLLGTDPLVATLAGTALGLSSTAVVSQVIAERRMEASPVTRSALAVLVIQDIAAIAVLILLASQGSSSEAGPGIAAAMGAAALKAALAFGGAMLLRRFAVGPIFALLGKTRQREAVTITALLLVLAAAALTSWLGLSLTLGAFLAGMMLADTKMHHVVQSELQPFRGLLLSFFFLTIGMSLDPGAMLGSLHWTLLALAACLSIKLVTVAAAAVLGGADRARAVRLAFLVTQGSEFAFVVLASYAVTEALGARLHGALLTSIVLSLIVTPWLATAGDRLALWLTRQQVKPDRCRDTDLKAVQPTVIAGLSTAGRRVAAGFEAHRVPYVVVEKDYESFTRGLSEGFPMVFGDLADLGFVEAISMADRPMIVLPELDLGLAQRVHPLVQQRFPGLVRLGGVLDPSDADAFAAIGGHAVVMRTEPIGLDLAAEALRRHRIDSARIAEWLVSQQAEVDEAEPISSIKRASLAERVPAAEIKQA
ncbi:MAG: cation:proton antiporter [Planctomycetota bacterium]